MAEAIKHRGPDGEGIWVKNNIGLGHRRLSIIDLSKKGEQPMCNEDQSVRLVCNGEIYNSGKLREELKKNGHKFKSKSDSETIVHLYEKYGTKFLEKLNGMFALAIWDGKKQRLIIARDRLGIKPLYYCVDGEKVIFSSEIKGIIAQPSFKREVDFESLHYYFFHNNIPAPKTIFKNILSVLPSEFIIFPKQGQIQKNKYWQLIFSENNIEDEKEASRHLFGLLEESVKSHMVSDVPTGVALSGGVDSSILVALLSKYSKNPVKTFSFSFENDTSVKHRDFEMAGKIARLFKTDHYTFVLRPRDLIHNLDRIVESLEMPINTFAFDYYLCREAAKKVKIIFTGDGTEELFGKYWNHRLAQSMAHVLDYLVDKVDYDYMEKRFVEKYSQIVSERSWHFSGLYSFLQNDRKNLYSSFLLKETKDYNVYDHLFSCFNQTTAKNFLNKVLEIDTHQFLANHTLTILDRVSMINSVELRPPFLDYRLVEYVASLPARLKSKQGITKYILKQSARRIIPETLIDKFRSGVTGPPISKWLLLPDLGRYVKQVLSPKRLRKHCFLREDYVNLIIKEHDHFKAHYRMHENYYFLNSSKNHTAKIWKLLMFQLWWEKYFL